MELKRKNLCPLLQKECVGLDCVWFTKLYGTDPQDKDKLIEEWDCAIVWQVKGLLEVAKRTAGGLDGVQQATESFRNEMVQINEQQMMTNPVLQTIVLRRQAARSNGQVAELISPPPPTDRA